MIAMTLGLGLTACNTQKPMDKETIICFETSKGDVKVKLYNETPKHRDNMIKLVKEGFYDGTLFHRVINRFMIQGGDPESKTAKPDQMLGDGDTGYTIPAEFAYPKYFHKKGALAAAREPDEVNPEMASSGCQFYIVTGKKFTREALKDMEDYLNDQRIREVYDSIARPYMKEMYLLRKSNQTDSLASLQDKLMTEAEAKAEHFAFTAEQKEAYSTVGGAPHLDGTYTVFGEVIEGMEVVEAIQKVKTNRADRPLEDVVIKKATVVKD
jgi:peptidylprolyl isomerase